MCFEVQVESCAGNVRVKRGMQNGMEYGMEYGMNAWTISMHV